MGCHLSPHGLSLYAYRSGGHSDTVFSHPGFEWKKRRKKLVDNKKREREEEEEEEGEEMKSRDKRCFALRENYLEFPGIDNAIDNVAYLSIF